MRDLSLVALLLVAACTTDRTRRAYLRNLAETLDRPQRPVVIVPGFGVTGLYDPLTRRHVWGTARATMHTRFDDDLDLPADDIGHSGRDRLVPRGYVGSRGPVNVGWQLTEALRKYGRYTVGQDVHPFLYDWRLSARDNARELALLVERIGSGRKVDLLTHSAGALIALAYVKLGGGADRVDRLIMLAPPQEGVIDAFRIFVRPERIVRRTFAPEAVATWPFVYELLPTKGRFVVRSDGLPIDFDVWDADTWHRVRARPSSAHLERARNFRAELAARPMPGNIRMTVIAGDCVPTTRAVLYRPDGTLAFYREDLRPDERHLAAVLFEPGDGTVPVSSARGSGNALLFCDGHQGLATDPNVHRAIIRALAADR